MPYINTQQWRRRIASSHRMSTRLSLWTEGYKTAQLPPVIVGDSVGTQGTITFDSTASTYRTTTFSIADPYQQYVPGMSQLLEPVGNEVFIEYAVDDGAGNWIYCPAGVFGIVTTESDSSLDQTTGTGSLGPYLTITGNDRSFVVGASTATEIIQTKNNASLGALTVQLIIEAVSWFPASIFSNINDGGAKVPSQIINVGDSIWDLLQLLWQGIGGYLYFDANGNLVGGLYSVTGTPSYDFSYGLSPTTGYSLPWDASNAYNGVTVIGSSPGSNPVSATAWDMNPDSPTFYLGPFGMRPAPPIQSPTATTTEQCADAAAAALPSLLGLAQPLTITHVPDPAIAEFEFATINYADMGVSGIWQLQQFTLPMDYTSSMSSLWAPTGSSNGGGTVDY